MRLTKESEYALLGLAVLASKDQGEETSLAAIAATTGLIDKMETDDLVAATEGLEGIPNFRNKPQCYDLFDIDGDGAGDVCEVKSGPGFQKAPSSELAAVMRRDGLKAEENRSARAGPGRGLSRFHGKSGMEAQALLLTRTDKTENDTAPD